MAAFSVIYLLFLSARAIFNPFVTVYLQESGLSPEKIGIVTGANSLVIVLSQPFWGIVSDKLGSVKKTLVFCMVFQAVFSLTLIYCSGFLPVAACFCLYGFFSSPEGPLLDTWSLKSLKEVGKEEAVGQLKLWGCLGYAVCSVVSGLVICQYSTKAILPVFSMVLIAIGLLLSRVRTGAGVPNAMPLKKLNLKSIFLDKRFLLFLAFIFFGQLPHRAAYTFYPLLITQLGGSKDMVGYTSAVMFVSEGIFLFLSRKLLTRWKPLTIVLCSSVFFVIWQFLYSIVAEPWQVAAIAVLDGPSYALFTIGTLYYLDVLAPPNIRATYQTIAYAVYFGLSGIVGNSVAGWVIETFGYRTMYYVGMAVLVVATALFMLAEQYCEKGWRKNENTGALR